MNHAKRQDGFTIIELLLAMSFIAALLLAIALTVIQIGAIYNRGMTLKEVNQTGRAISADIQRSISNSAAFDLSTNLLLSPNGAGGRLCTGQFSYVWNYAEAIASGNNLISYAGGGDPIRFVKIPDASAAYCARSGSAPLYPNVRAADQSVSVELLKTGDRTLSIHNFTITTSATANDPVTGQRLYSVNFTIGTGDVTALAPGNTRCLAPGETATGRQADFTYCAVQQFSLVLRAGNRVN